MNILPANFYLNQPTLQIAESLLGKLLISRINGMETSGRIVETEAYLGIQDKASHAFGNRRTARTEVMFGEGGQAYVYLCYGLHHLLNIVTQPAEIPHAVLLRGIDPVEGITEMQLRRGISKKDSRLTRGPGSLAKALGINTTHNRQSFCGPLLLIADDGFEYDKDIIGKSKRIGVDYAAEDADLPYRFYVKGNKNVSAKPNR